MAQLVQLQENLGALIKKHNANVLVVLREESEGQDGLKKVVAQTKTTFTLALDRNAEKTKRYSPGKMDHDSYIIDSEGVIRAILAGTRYHRAQSDEFAKSLTDEDSPLVRPARPNGAANSATQPTPGPLRQRAFQLPVPAPTRKSRAPACYRADRCLENPRRVARTHRFRR